MQKAATNPELLKRIYDHYRDAKLPTEQFFMNILEGVIVD